MKKTVRAMTLRFGTALLAVLTLTAMAPAEETHVGSTLDSRVVLGFAAPDEAVQAMMPEGWKAFTLPKGPLAGTNVIVVLIDRHLNMDTDYKPSEPAASRSAVLASFGIQPDAPPRLFVTRIYSTDEVNDPYSVAGPAAIARTHMLETGEDGTATRSEDWVISPAEGGEMTIRYSHIAGIPVWSEGESKTYSAADPDFYRIYRYRQADDLAMSEALGKSLAGEITVSVAIPELDALFNGEERVTAVISRPFYTRDTILP